MRFIHTSDWHLGRLFHNQHLTDDQRFTLEAFTRTAEELRPDAIVIAGDIYDRAVPPTEAVTLLDDILAKLTLELEIPVILIAGNHDSPVRIGYMAGLVGRMGLHVVGPVGASPTGIPITDAAGVTTTFWLLAYTDPETARGELARDDIHSHEAAIGAQIDIIKAQMDTDHRHVIVGHAFVAGAQESESERPLSVGGTGVVSTAVFEGFDYVALGHLHRPQQVSPTVRYSGSLLKYSFSEAEHTKSITLVTLEPGAAPVIEEVSLPTRRDLVRISGTFDDLISDPQNTRHAGAYIEATLMDGAEVLDPLDRLRAVYPYILNLKRADEWATQLNDVSREARNASVDRLFETFYQEVTGEPLTPPQHDVLGDVLAQFERESREVAS